MELVAVIDYTIKRIDDGKEFQSSIPSMLGDVHLHLILDLHYADNGRARFTQILGRD